MEFICLVRSDKTPSREPFVFYERNSEGEIVGFSGISFEIVKVLQEIFNFT